MKTPLPPREATKDEIAWCNRMRRLMKQKPKSITLFCNGSMNVLCTDAVNNQIRKGGCMPQPLEGIECLGQADGGDF